jgi:hypothetical protein
MCNLSYTTTQICSCMCRMQLNFSCKRQLQNPKFLVVFWPLIKNSTPNPFTQDLHIHSLKNSTPHICNLNLHICSLKHCSLTIAIAHSETLHLTFTACETFLIHISCQDKAATMSRHTGDENPIVKAHGRETKKRQGETWGSTKIGAFMSFTLYFFPLFQAHLSFFIAPWVLVTLDIT